MKLDGLSPAVRDRLRRLPPPYDSHFGVFPLPPPRHAIGTLSPAVEAALVAIQQFDARLKRSPNGYSVRLSALQDAFRSCAIAGIDATRDDLFHLRKTGEGTAAAKLVRDYDETLIQTVQRASKEGPKIFTRALVENIHTRLMQSDTAYRDKPGQLRSRVVWIGSDEIANSIRNPPPPDAVAGCLEDTLEYMRNGAQSTQDIITKMAIAHVHFEAVHPFLGGSGRTGRLLMSLMMAAEGHVPLFLSSYLAEHADAHQKALQHATIQMDYAPMIELIACTVVDLCPVQFEGFEHPKRSA